MKGTTYAVIIGYILFLIICAFNAPSFGDFIGLGIGGFLAIAPILAITTNYRKD